MTYKRDWTPTSYRAATWPHKREGYEYKDFPGTDLGCYLVSNGGWFVDMRYPIDRSELLGTQLGGGKTKGNFVIPIRSGTGERLPNVIRDRWVLLLFGAKPPLPGDQCRHRDYDPMNGDISNLFWAAAVKYNKVVLDEILRQRRQGKTLRDVADNFDTSPTVIRDVLIHPPKSVSKWNPRQMEVLEAYRQQQAHSADSFAPLPDLTDEQILGLA